MLLRRFGKGKLRGGWFWKAVSGDKAEVPWTLVPSIS
jgi:hypothetical protein